MSFRKLLMDVDTPPAIIFLSPVLQDTLVLLPLPDCLPLLHHFAERWEKRRGRGPFTQRCLNPPEKGGADKKKQTNFHSLLVFGRACRISWEVDVFCFDMKMISQKTITSLVLSFASQISTKQCIAVDSDSWFLPLTSNIQNWGKETKSAQVWTRWCHSSSLPDIEDFFTPEGGVSVRTHRKVRYKLLTWYSTSETAAWIDIARTKRQQNRERGKRGALRNKQMDLRPTQQDGFYDWQREDFSFDSQWNVFFLTPPINPTFLLKPSFCFEKGIEKFLLYSFYKLGLLRNHPNDRPTGSPKELNLLPREIQDLRERCLFISSLAMCFWHGL